MNDENKKSSPVDLEKMRALVDTIAPPGTAARRMLSPLVDLVESMGKACPVDAPSKADAPDLPFPHMVKGPTPEPVALLSGIVKCQEAMIINLSKRIERLEFLVRGDKAFEREVRSALQTCLEHVMSDGAFAEAVHVAEQAGEVFQGQREKYRARAQAAVARSQGHVESLGLFVFDDDDDDQDD